MSLLATYRPTPAPTLHIGQHNSKHLDAIDHRKTQLHKPLARQLGNSHVRTLGQLAINLTRPTNQPLAQIQISERDSSTTPRCRHRTTLAHGPKNVKNTYKQLPKSTLTPDIHPNTNVVPAGQVDMEQIWLGLTQT